MARVKKKKQKSDRTKRLRLKRWSLVLKILIICGVTGFAGKYIYDYREIFSPKYISNKFYNFTGNLGFKVENIYLEGLKYENKEKVSQAINLKANQPILSVDLKQIKDKLEKLEWIKHAVVDRQLPNTIYIGVVERKIVAMGQKQKKLHLIDNEGKILNTKNIKPFIDLPIIIGDGAEIHATTILMMLQKDPLLYKKIHSITRISERRWNVTFDNNVEVKLPEKDVEKAWDLVIKLNNNNQLFKDNISSIDLRVKGKLFVEKNKK